MLSALITTPPSCSASTKAKADLPLAVGPAMTMAGSAEVFSDGMEGRSVAPS
jgi:hypothetical protein